MTDKPRKPRKMPKNQRAYPKKGKPRFVQVTDPRELQTLIEHSGEIGYPLLVVIQKAMWAKADELRKWRALRNPPTSSAEQT